MRNKQTPHGKIEKQAPEIIGSLTVIKCRFAQQGDLLTLHATLRDASGNFFTMLNAKHTSALISCDLIRP